MEAYKGFNKDLTCLGFQYKEGEKYSHNGKLKVCESGFHAVENPLDLFGYYAPAQSVFHAVETGGEEQRHSEDTKIACSEIRIGAEFSIESIVEAGIKFVFDKCDWSKKEKNSDGTQGAASQTGYRGAASQTGARGAASQTGDRGAASQTGDQGAASQTGDQGAASQTGTRGAASQTGDQGAALTTGTESSSEIVNSEIIKSKNGVAIALGKDSKAKAPAGNFIVLVEYNDSGDIETIKAAKVDGKKIKADTWYSLKNGKIIQAKEV